jgi:hypothetical protein
MAMLELREQQLNPIREVNRLLISARFNFPQHGEKPLAKFAQTYLASKKI